MQVKHMKRCDREARIFSRYVRNWTFVFNPSLVNFDGLALQEVVQRNGSSIPQIVSRLIGAVYPPESYALDRRMQWASGDRLYVRKVWSLDPTRLPQ
jgi:hypothetical protein